MKYEITMKLSTRGKPPFCFPWQWAGRSHRFSPLPAHAWPPATHPPLPSPSPHAARTAARGKLEP